MSGRSKENIAATVDREFTSTVTFRFGPAPLGISNLTDESEVQALINKAVGPSDTYGATYGPSFALTLD